MENGAGGIRTDSYQSPLGFSTGSGTPAILQGKTIILSDGTRVNTSPQVQQVSGQVQQVSGVQYATAPQQASTSDSDGGGSSITSGVFDDVGKVYKDLRANAAAVEDKRNSIFNRNLNRKNFALNAATTTSNLATAGQQRQQADITFGQGQADRISQLNMAAAASKGIADGLLAVQGAK